MLKLYRHSHYLLIALIMNAVSDHRLMGDSFYPSEDALTMPADLIDSDEMNAVYLIKNKKKKRPPPPPAPQEQSLVTATLGGQLGNQIFMVAATLAYAWDNNARPIFPDLNLTDEVAVHACKFPINKERFFFRLDTSEPSRPFTASFNSSNPYLEKKVPFQRDVRLNCCFQSFNLFHHHRKKLLDIFAPSSMEIEYLRSKYSELISAPNTVSIHVRTYDESCHNDYGVYFAGMKYYKEAMDLFPEDSVFVVFSDRIQWCKVHFQQLKKNFVFIEGNDAIQDLFLITFMKNHIIANSTFSWWGAYLDPNPNAIVVAPEYWLNPRLQSSRPDLYLYLPNWIRVKADYDAPYPSDIRAYDKYSLSVDTQ